jgi:NAD(P)-dependent dehydrogenase (short-subunit alcohol dehydrogenase family)
MARTFGAQSTTDQVLEGIDLSGKRVLVTGVSAGLGVETARVLAAHGAWVVGTARDLAKAERAIKEVKSQSAKSGGIELMECDLASLASVRGYADKLNAAGKPFDVVIANAGVMACPRGRTADGFETQFGVNHLGHFLLINRIAPLIRSGGRVVSLASLAHHFSDVDLDDPNFERTPYVEFVAYGRSKTANVLFAVEFDRRHRMRGVHATAVHPGSIRTELLRHLTPEITKQIMPRTSGSSPNRTFKSIPQGAATTVWAGFVAQPEEIGGKYCEDCHVAELTENPAARDGVRGYALDPERAKALWAKSEEMVGPVR